MSETPSTPPGPDTPERGSSLSGGQWALIIGAIVAVLAVIVVVAFLRGEPADLAIDPDPTPDATPDEPVDEPDEPDEPDEADEHDGVASDPVAAAAAWVAAQVAGDGSVEAGFSGPVGNATQAALALAAAEAGGDAFDRAVAYVDANVDGYVVGEDGDAPGAIGYVLLLADAAGEDHTAFGGGDLVERLEAVRRTDGDDAGLYGAADPSFDGTFRQSLAILGLVASAVEPDGTAIAWLLEQQCDDGGFAAYRPADSRDDPCDPETSPPDTNSTALAIQALAAAGVDAEHDAVGWLEEAQNDDGGFGFDLEFAETDANSTGLVLQALAAAGEDPTDSRWTRDGTPIDALLSLQVGCDAPADQQGAFAFQPAEDGTLEANPATYQALWGLTGSPFPFGERAVTGEPTPLAC